MIDTKGKEKNTARITLHKPATSMFNQKTVLVVGAGASRELGLPLGSELIETIQRITDFRFDYGTLVGTGDTRVLDALRERARRLGFSINEYTRRCGELRAGVGFTMSIDNYLHSRSSDKKIVEIGKMSIVKAILDAEQSSTVYIDPRNPQPFSAACIANSWLLPFLRILTANVKKDQLKSIFENIAIVCFNYDRLIEYVLYESLKLTYSLSDDETRDIMLKLEIIHPYGTVGSLHWQEGANKAGLGDNNNSSIDLISDEIFLFTEQRDNPDLSAFIDRNVKFARKMMFLGFGYYRQNMELITTSTEKSIRIAGTALGLSEADRQAVDAMLINNYTNPGKTSVSCSLEAKMCKDMIQAYSRFLADI